MQALNKGSDSRTEDRTQRGSLTPTLGTAQRTAAPDPNASLSENFGAGFTVDDHERPDDEQPGPAAARSQSNALPPPKPVGKRRGVPGSEAVGDQPTARTTRSNSKRPRTG